MLIRPFTKNMKTLKVKKKGERERLRRMERGGGEPGGREERWMHIKGARCRQVQGVAPPGFCSSVVLQNTIHALQSLKQRHRQTFSTE